MKVKVGISNRHVHLSEEVKNILFGSHELSKRNDLSQYGEYACEETITIKTSKSEIKSVRVMGPLRNYTQVEISKTDSYFLGINPPVRNSGDLKESESITLIGPEGTYELREGVIISNRHIHISSLDARNLGFENDDIVKVSIEGEKAGVLDNVHIKVGENYKLELHIDTDDANAFLVKNGEEVEII